MASQVLIPYYFTDASFKETCLKMHFFGTDDQYEFFLTHQLPKNNDKSLLISIDDLLRKKTETKLNGVISQLKTDHPDQAIHAKPLVIDELNHTIIQQHKIDYLAFDLDQSKPIERHTHHPNATSIYFRKSIWNEKVMNLLWLKPNGSTTKQYEYIKTRQLFPSNFSLLKQIASITPPFCVDTFSKISEITTKQQFDIVIVS